MLIHRPVLHAGFHNQANSSILAVAESSKHIIQILQLLQERSLGYTICINKSELIISCGFGLIYQVSELSPESKIYKDSQQYITTCVDLLEKSGAPTVISFRKIAKAFVVQSDSARPSSHGSFSDSASPKSPQEPNKSTKGQLHALAARFSLSGIRSSKSRSQSIKSDQSPAKSGYAIGHNGTMIYNASTSNLPSTTRVRNTQSAFSPTSSEPVLKHQVSTPSMSLGSVPHWTPNLDYLALGSSASVASPIDTTKIATARAVADWDGLLNSLDTIDVAACDQFQIGDTTPQYAIRHCSDSSFATPPVQLDWNLEWNAADSWALFDLTPQEQPIAAKSVLSFSDESTSGEDLSSCDMGSEFRGYSIRNDDYCNLPQTTSPDTTKV